MNTMASLFAFLKEGQLDIRSRSRRRARSTEGVLEMQLQLWLCSRTALSIRPSDVMHDESCPPAD